MAQGHLPGPHRQTRRQAGPRAPPHHLPPTLQKKDPSKKSSEGTLESAVAARSLGLTERQIGLRVRRFSIDFKRFRRGDEPAAAKVTSA
jgi:transcriptional regulator with GAF, ATPase, and Fis domain